MNQFRLMILLFGLSNAKKETGMISIEVINGCVMLRQGGRIMREGTL